jgi:hypothetical protein
MSVAGVASASIVHAEVSESNVDAKNRTDAVVRARAQTGLL